MGREEEEVGRKIAALELGTAAATATPGVAEMSAAELADIEAKKRERKERKKLRKQESRLSAGRASAAVIPAEPNGSVLHPDGSRGCRSVRDFVPLCRLGQGAFGRVMLVRWRGDGRAYAMKAVRADETSSSTSMAEQLLVERRVLTELSHEPHPLLASARCCFRSARHLHFVMDFLQGGTLARHLSEMPTNPKAMPEETVRFYAAQIALALGALHSRGMLYLDLKLENVIISARGDATLVDFGFVRCDVDVAAGQTVKRVGGTRCYLAPEAIMGQPVGAACDWWALGVLVFELLVGYLPFRGDNDKALGSAICNARVRFPREESDGALDVTDGGEATSAQDGRDAGAAGGVGSGGGGVAQQPGGGPKPPSADAVALVRRLLTKKAEARLGSKEGVVEVSSHAFLRQLEPSDLLDSERMPRPLVPTLDADVDVRYFERKHTSHTAPISAEDQDASAEAQSIAAANAAAARRMELAAKEAELVAAAAADAKAVAGAKRLAAANAADAARAAVLKEAEDAAIEAQKRLRAAQKKLRGSAELREEHERGGKTLNSEQRKKLEGIPRLQEEVNELTETAAALDAALKQTQQKHAVESSRVEEARRAVQEEVDNAAQCADAAAREQDAERERRAKRLAGLLDELSIEKFAFVATEWL
jgi:serine/threonine protein kinase